MEIKPEDLHLNYFRSAIPNPGPIDELKITHLPTGIVVKAKTRKEAMQLLVERLEFMNNEEKT